VSKKLQSPAMCTDSTLDLIQDMKEYFESYKKEGFSNCLTIARDIVNDMIVPASFPVKCHAMRKKQFDEIDSQEEILEAERIFKVKYLLVMVDVESLNDSELERCCTKFANTFMMVRLMLRLHDLIFELKILKCTLPNDTLSAMEIFQHIRDVDCYPNTSIAYQILFTVHVTIASAQRCFSKLKLLKNYLRSPMSQERLNDLASLCTEKKLLDEIDINSVIDVFVSKNFRRNFTR
jgi:hypothetical protein